MLFHGKRVAIIGPAPIEKDYTEIINSCDIVVRLNESLPLNSTVKELTTDRCEVLYIWRKVYPNDAWDSVQEIRLKTDAIFADDWRKHRHWKYREKMAVVEPYFFYNIKEKLGCRINTGLMAVAEIVAHKPELLFITGITFYQEGKAYVDGYVSKELNQKITGLRGNLAQHKQRPQLEYFVKKIYPLPFVKCGERLDSICQNVIL